MSSSVESLVNKEYKYGFVTDIDSDTAPRGLSEDVVRMLVTAGTQLAHIVSEARTLGQFVAPAHERLRSLAQNLWWSWDTEATNLFREIDPVLWQQVLRFQLVTARSVKASRARPKASSGTESAPSRDDGESRRTEVGIGP